MPDRRFPKLIVPLPRLDVLLRALLRRKEQQQDKMRLIPVPVKDPRFHR